MTHYEVSMQTKFGDILTQTSGIIIQQVNAQGVMGSGIARQIRNKYPAVFSTYLSAVGAVSVKRELLGSVIPVQVTPQLAILNIVGQLNYGRDPNIQYTSYEALDAAFKSIRVYCLQRDCSWPAGDINIPEIGAGLGNGDWTVIQQIITSHLDSDFCRDTGRDLVFWKFAA